MKQINHHPNILTLSCDFPEMSFNCIIYEQCLPFVLHYFLKYEYFHKNINFAFIISNILSKMFKMCSEKCQTTSKHHFVNLKCSQLFIFFLHFLHNLSNYHILYPNPYQINRGTFTDDTTLTVVRHVSKHLGIPRFIPGCSFLI